MSNTHTHTPAVTLCFHGCGAPAEGGIITWVDGVTKIGYCDTCNRDDCLVPGPDGDGVCGKGNNAC